MVLVEIAGALDKVAHLPGGVEAVQATLLGGHKVVIPIDLL